MRGDKNSAVTVMVVVVIAVVAVLAVLVYLNMGGGGLGAGDAFMAEVWYEDGGLELNLVSVRPSLTSSQAAALDNQMPAGSHTVRLELWTVEGPTPHREDKIAEAEWKVRTREDWGAGKKFTTFIGGVDGIEFSDLGGARLSIVLYYDDVYDYSNIFTLNRDYTIKNQE